MEISHRLQALDFTEVGVAQFTSYAKPQAVNGRLDSTLSISKTTNQSESVTLKGRPDCLIMGKVGQAASVPASLLWGPILWRQISPDSPPDGEPSALTVV